MSSSDENKIERDQDFYEELLKLPEMDGWSGNNHSPYELIEIETGTTEWTKAVLFFKRKNFSHTPYKVQRIENPFLYGQFLLKKHKLTNTQTNTNSREQDMFHGTKEENLDKICSENFNWRLKGSARGVKFGQGVSFSPDAFYASHFGNVMILVNVMIGRSHRGNLTTSIPIEPYTTTDNGKNTVYVKYEDDDFYPQYVIYYR